MGLFANVQVTRVKLQDGNKSKDKANLRSKIRNKKIKLDSKSC